MAKAEIRMTEGPIGKQLVSFAIPLFLGFLFQQLYNTADALIVGNMLGNGALAAVTGTGTLIFLLVGFFGGISMGAGDLKRTRKGARFGILCSIIIAEAIGALLYAAAPLLIRAFTQEPEAIAFGVQKMRTCALFYFLLALSHCLAAVMRGAGRAVIPMISMLAFWCVVRVGIIAVATPVFRSIAVVNWVYPITWALSSLFLLIYYLKANWMTVPDKLDKADPPVPDAEG